MALDAATVWEVQTGGSDDNGGGYSSGGTDYSQQTSAQWNDTDLACSDHGTYQVSSAGSTFTSAAVGNLMHITTTGTGGHFVTGWYKIASYVDANNVKLDRDPTDGNDETAGTFYVGGCLATPGGLGKVLNDHGVDGMSAYIKSGTYTMTSDSANVSGGTVAIPADEGAYYLEGYETTRGDLGAKPVLDAAAYTSIILWSLGGGAGLVNTAVNLKADGQDNSDVIGFAAGGYYSLVYRCEAIDCPTGFSGVFPRECLADSCATRGFSGGSAFHCEAKGCGVGFYQSNPIACLAHGNTTGFRIYAGGSGQAYCCGAWDNSGDGFISTYEASYIAGCWAVNNGGYGFNVHNGIVLVRCADYNNTSGKRPAGQLFTDIGHQTLTGDPFEASGSDDFRPDNTANEGALLRGTGGRIASQTNNTDIGPVQHSDPVPLINLRRNTLIGR